MTKESREYGNFIYLPSALHRRIEESASDHGSSLIGFVTLAVSEKLRRIEEERIQLSRDMERGASLRKMVSDTVVWRQLSTWLNL